MNKITFGIYISFMIVLTGVIGYYIYTGTKEGPKEPNKIVKQQNVADNSNISPTNGTTTSPSVGPVKTYDPDQYYDQYGNPITLVSPTPTVKPTKPAKTTRPPIYRTYKPRTEKPDEDENNSDGDSENDTPTTSATPLPVRTPFPVPTPTVPYVTGFTLPPTDTDEPVQTEGPTGSYEPTVSDEPTGSDNPEDNEEQPGTSIPTSTPTTSDSPVVDDNTDDNNSTLASQAPIETTVPTPGEQPNVENATN